MLEQQTSPSAQSSSSAAGARARQDPPQRAPDASLTETADQAVRSVAALYTAADEALAQQVQGSPYATLAAAAAVGFVLGGGLRSPIGQVLFRMSVRTFGPPLINAALHGVIERATAAIPQPQPQYAAPSGGYRGQGSTTHARTPGQPGERT